jgi:F-type H+-transporting ATPase subunit gamma
VIRRLLPLPTKQANSHLGVLSPVVQKDAPPPRIGDFIYEPDPQSVLNTILPRFTEIQIYQAILEALASEHSARMVAMRSATDNANALLAELTLSYHRARQSSITREMLDIAGGVEAMRQRR